MKALKLSAIALALVSTSAMANVVTDTANAVGNTASSVVSGGKTLFKTFTNPAAISAEVGTLGYGANVAFSVNPSTELQAGWAGGEFETDFDSDGVNYDANLDYSNPYLGVQLRPASNWLTVGAGVIVPDNKIALKANPSASEKGATYNINDKDYLVSEVGSLEGNLKYTNAVAPYVTVGFRPNSNNRWGVFGEVGGAYMGEPKAKIKASNNTAIAQQAAAEAQAEIDREVADKKYLEWYPIVKVGATVRF